MIQGRYYVSPLSSKLIKYGTNRQAALGDGL
jgi:hypothetical protein